MDLEVWYSPMARCWRVEDGIMFTYYDVDSIVGHFRFRDQPRGASLVGVRTDWHPALRRALVKAAIPFADYTEDRTNV